MDTISRVLIASITALCTADHGNDADKIASWIANKNPEGIARMLADPNNAMFVAEHDGVVAAVGLISGNRIGLNYVDPDHRRVGVSKALLAHMERELSRHGVTMAVLDSTETALAFYQRAGWSQTGACGASGCRPMQKGL